MTKTNDLREKAIVFIDYEHWYYSIKNNFGTIPNIRHWRNKLAENHSIEELYVFGDFSKKEISNELPRIREITNTIIETKSDSSYTKKDFTDFIMLDHIYQKANLAKHIDNFIIFTGDGHFCSVVSFLRYQCNKTVGVYGVKKSFSSQLKGIASWFIEIPDEKEQLLDICQMILQNFHNIDMKRKIGKIIRPSYKKTVEIVSRMFNIDDTAVSEGLTYLIDQDFVYRSTEVVSFNTKIVVYGVDWNRVEESGIFNMKDISDGAIPVYCG